MTSLPNHFTNPTLLPDEVVATKIHPGIIPGRDVEAMFTQMNTENCHANTIRTTPCITPMPSDQGQEMRQDQLADKISQGITDERIQATRPINPLTTTTDPTPYPQKTPRGLPRSEGLPPRARRNTKGIDMIYWDKQNINDLQLILAALPSKKLETVEWHNLPSHDIPDDIDTTEVWAMDVNGHCLCGLIHDIVEGRGQIKHISELRGFK